MTTIQTIIAEKLEDVRMKRKRYKGYETSQMYFTKAEVKLQSLLTRLSTKIGIEAEMEEFDHFIKDCERSHLRSDVLATFKSIYNTCKEATKN